MVNVLGVGDVVLGHPGVLQDLLEADPGVLVDGETGLDEVNAGGGQFSAVDKVRFADVIVPLEGDVPTDHIVEEDAQTPDGQGVALVSLELDPLRRRINSGSWNGKNCK